MNMQLHPTLPHSDLNQHYCECVMRRICDRFSVTPDEIRFTHGSLFVTSARNLMYWILKTMLSAEAAAQYCQRKSRNSVDSGSSQMCSRIAVDRAYNEDCLAVLESLREDLPEVYSDRLMRTFNRLFRKYT